MTKPLFLITGHLSLLLGIVGAFLPVLPTTPFLLLAAYCYSKSNAKLHSWILRHKYFGPPITDWEQNGVIGLKAKVFATIMLALVVVFRVPSLPTTFLLKSILTTILTFVLIFIWSRPSHNQK